jgi:hypothetical protein
MAFTRFNYDYQRTAKLLQESTGPGRYILNKPGNGPAPCYFEDPHIRLQEWGANLQHVKNGGGPVDIASDLDGRTRRLTKYCTAKEYPNKGVVKTEANKYSTCKAYTDETRASHPAWMYRDLEQTRWEYPLLNPQENVCKSFHNNISTRILEKDNYVPTLPPCLFTQK